MPSSIPSNQDEILICGAWLDPRSGGISGVVHELIATLNHAGKNVHFICDAFAFKQRLGPNAICFMSIRGDRPFDREVAAGGKQVYSSVSALLAHDQSGGLASRRGLLAKVGIIHTHSDSFIPPADPQQDSGNHYHRLASYIAAQGSIRPRIVRTRHDDLQGPLCRFMMLTGIDYVELGRDERRRLLDGETDLVPIVDRRVRECREQLKSWGWDDQYLDEAIHHVSWVIQQLQSWRREINHADAVVYLSRPGMEEAKDFLLCEESRKLTYVHVGSSFGPVSQARVDRLLYNYHHRAGLHCYRGASDRVWPIRFTPSDRKAVFVGRAVREKGIYELCESLRDLRGNGHRNIRGVFVGNFDAPTRRRLSGIDPNEASEYLFFAGPLRDPDLLASVFAFGDVTVIASHHDSSAAVGLESYRMGTPCVVTESTGAGEMYLDHPRRRGAQMALAVRRKSSQGIARFYGVDVGSLSTQIAAMIDHPFGAKEMAEKGAAFVRQYYSSERMGKTYLRLYDILRNGGQASELQE